MAKQTQIGCELLSNCIFAWKGHNLISLMSAMLGVVSCFQIVSSPGKATTLGADVRAEAMVVSCFQIVSSPGKATTTSAKN